MNRSPVYAKKNEGYRIVSVPNGLWRVQERAVGKSKTRDPWENISPAIPYDEAQGVLSRYHVEG